MKLFVSDDDACAVYARTLWQATCRGVYQSEGVFVFFPSPFSRYSELFVHGLGAAIHRAINLALQLKETSSHTLEVRRYNTTPSMKA